MFQVLDDKENCFGFYRDGEIFYSDVDFSLDRTWSYIGSLKGLDIDYAQLFCEGKNLEDICPEYLKKDFEKISKKIKAYLSSFLISKVSLKENCLFDLLPERSLKEYCEIKNRISEHVFETHKRPAEYTFIRQFNELLCDIGNRDLIINKDRIKDRLYHPQGKKLLTKVNSGSTSIKYNMFSSKTGRLVVADKSFPVLTLPASYRDVLIPTNDWYVALDFNAAEMRIALALAGEKQSENDLHEHVKKQVFEDLVTRTQAKSLSTQWLYDAKNKDVVKYDTQLSKFYNKTKLFNDFWKDGYVCTPYNRKIPADSHHVISYLCQSTFIDMFHRQLVKLFNFLDSTKTKIAFIVHDQVVIDLKDSEKHILPQIIKIISDTPYGNFPTKVEIGKNYGEMKKVKIKV